MNLRKLAIYAVAIGIDLGLPAQGWVDRTATGGPPLGSPCSMAFDAVHGESILVLSPSSGPFGGNQTWSWNGASWQLRGSAPYGLLDLVWHPPSQQIVALAIAPGQSSTPVMHVWNGNAWALAYSSSSSASVNGIAKPAGAYDPTSQQVVWQLPNSMVAVFDGTTLDVRQPTSPALGSWNRGAATDPITQRAVLAAEGSEYRLIGASWVAVPIVRFYQWNGFGWNQRPTTIAPGFLAGLATDPSRNRIVLLDGDYPGSLTVGGSQDQHTWTYADGSVSRVPTAFAPVPRQSAAMTFDSNRAVVVMFGGSIGGSSLADTWEFDLGPLASYTSYGSGCTGTFGIPTIAPASGSLPRIGTTFTLQASNLPLSGPAFLAIGFSDTVYSGAPLPLDLGVIGAPGCNLLCAIDGLYPLTNVLGTATWSIGIPVIPGGRFFNQVIPFDPTANPLGLTTSNGGHAVLGL